MHAHPNKKPSHPCRECSNTQQQCICTDINLMKKTRCYSGDLHGNKCNSENKLCSRSHNRSKVRQEASKTLYQDSHTSSRRRFNDVVLVNITDQHTANIKYIAEQKKAKKGSKLGKKSQKDSVSGSINGSLSSKTIMRVKHNVKENNPGRSAKSKKGVVVTCSCKMRPSDLIAQRNVEDTIKSAINNATVGDPIKNALHLTKQIKTNIDSIRAQSNKRSSLRGLPQSKYVVTSKGAPQIKPDSALITAPYLQQLKNEINSNRSRCPPSCISHVNQDILDLRNEILQYRLKSEEDLPQAMVIEVSYINENEDGETVKKNQIVSKKYPLSCDVTCDKYTECQHNCNFNLIDYSKISEKQPAHTSKSGDSLVSIQPFDHRFSCKGSSNDSVAFQQKGITRVSLTGKKVASMKKSSTPGTEDGDSTGHAFDELDADPVHEAWYKDSTQDERFISTEANFPLIEESFLNESFLRDQIAGMQKIDKLVEEAEQSIGKVVKGFDKYFKDPKINYPSIDSEYKRKNIEFKIDESCDCSSIIRCDCENHELSQVSLLGRSVAPFTYPIVEHPSESDHLNTISERTETNAMSSLPASHSEPKSLFSDTTEGKLSEKNPMDKRNIVHLPPIVIPVEKAPMLQETGTETDSIFSRIQTNVLEVQTMPGVEIRPSFKVQKIYNIDIKPTSNITDQSDVKNNKNALYIELKHNDPVCVETVDSRPTQKKTDFSTVNSTKQNEIVQEITVLKAPNPGMSNQESVAQSHYRRMNKNCRLCLHDRSTLIMQKKDKDIKQLLEDIGGLQIPIVSASSNSSNTSSEYIVVQDNETQVSIKGNEQRVPCLDTCQTSDDEFLKTPPQETISIGNNTSTDTFPTNIRPPIPGLPLSSYLPFPYDNEEIEEMLISAEPLEDSDVTPYDLTIIKDSKEAEAECSAQCVAIQLADDMQLTEQVSCEFTLENCSLTALEPAQKTKVPDTNEVICLANAFDFNPGRDVSNNCVVVPSQHGQEVCHNNVVEQLTPMPINEGAHNTLTSVNYSDFHDSNLYKTNKSDNISPNSVTIAAIDMQDSGTAITSDLDLNPLVLQPPTPNTIPFIDIGGMHIREPVLTTTAMPAMVQYDKHGVAESLGQNLLLAQLPDDASTIAYHKLPLSFVESTSTESSSHSSGDYPHRHKYLVRAKRRKAYQRGIITDDEGDLILSRSPDRGDPMSDGEMSQYTSSTGEVIPIGPDLLKNRNFMRRRPDRIFQMELMQRNMHVQRQYNYFNNWVSYYVSANQPMRR